MSWDATLHCNTCSHPLNEWNYTHNTNLMAKAVITPNHPAWWVQLDRLPGPEGAHLLNQIIDGLEADPDRFRAMNPDNGYGDYDGFLDKLRQMRDAVPEHPTTWRVWG